MDLYVINLDRHAARWDRMQASLVALGLAPSRIRAVDGMRFRPETRRGSADYVMSRFEIACVLSHRRAWRALLASGEPAAIVMEDDLVFGEDFAAFAADPGLGETGFDLIHLETFWGRVLVDHGSAANVAGREIAELLTTHWGAAGYVVTRDAARRLLAASRWAPLPADWLLFDAACFERLGLRVGQVLPAIVVQDQHPVGPAASAAPESAIELDRGRRLALKVKRRGWRRLARELARPFQQVADLVGGGLARLAGRPAAHPDHPSPDAGAFRAARRTRPGVARLVVGFR